MLVYLFWQKQNPPLKSFHPVYLLGMHVIGFSEIADSFSCNRIPKKNPPCPLLLQPL